MPYKTYLSKGLTQDNYNHGFKCSLAKIKNRYPLASRGGRLGGPNNVNSVPEGLTTLTLGKNATLRSCRLKSVFSRSRDQCAANRCTNFTLTQLLVRVRGLVRVVEFGTSSAYREWVRVRVLECGTKNKVT